MLRQIFLVKIWLTVKCPHVLYTDRYTIIASSSTSYVSAHADSVLALLSFLIWTFWFINPAQHPSSDPLNQKAWACTSTFFICNWSLPRRESLLAWSWLMIYSLTHGGMARLQVHSHHGNENVQALGLGSSHSVSFFFFRLQ